MPPLSRLLLLPLATLGLATAGAVPVPAADYAVVVSKTTYADPAWHRVADALAAKHHARIITHPAGKPAAAKAALAACAPSYAAFVTRPEECGRAYCTEVFRMIRALDADPYEDAVWGVITGVDAASALHQVDTGRDIVIRNGLGTTGLTESRFENLFVLSDAKEADWVSLKPGEPLQHGHGHAKPDSTVWAEKLAELKPELLVTSAHGFQDGVEMPFSRGMVRTHAAALRVMDISARHSYSAASKAEREELLNNLPVIPPESTPRAWLAAGNCLTGHCHSADSLVAVTMSRYGVYQFAGFSVVSWYGFNGWGSLGLFLDGRHDVTMTDAIWFTRQNALTELARITPAALAYNPVFDETDATGNDVDRHDAAVNRANLFRRGGDPARARDLSGLLWERDTFVMYGDPALAVRFAGTGKPDAAKLTFKTGADGTARLTATWPAGAKTEDLPPLGFRFPKKLATAPKPAPGNPTDMIVADDFLLIAKPKPDANNTLVIDLLPPASETAR